MPLPLLTGVLTFRALSLLLDDVYLTLRQRRVAQKSTTMPDSLSAITNQETFTKARMYSLDKSAFHIWHSVFSFVQMACELLVGWYALSWSWAGSAIALAGFDDSYEVTQSCVFMVITSIVSTIIELPWDYFFAFVIEARHGFNKQVGE